ncbi:hypothetical protein [Kitasatospora sp. NPDC088134]|uniref:hypothetical protein n=1 Tax=Kitasatospora sp. NPDC088134 TaxID=3364071 RepID=UPI0038169204
MTTFKINDRARWTTSRHPDFVPLVEEALHLAAPMAERYAAMTLPPKVTVDLLTPTAVREATREHGRLLGHRVAALFDHPDEQATAYRFTAGRLHSFAQAHRRIWPLVGGRTLLGTDGRYLAVMPAMHTARRTSLRALVQALGHELVHIMQLHRSPDLDDVFYAQHVEAGFGRREETTVRPLQQIAEGHAMWVHRQIVAELGGVDDDFPDDPLPNAWSRRRRRAVLGLQKTTRSEVYLPGLGFMNALAAVGGPELVASVFDSTEQLPTRAELTDPQQWLTREHNRLVGPAPATAR